VYNKHKINDQLS